jgi:deferrochelatase/peroxidase EfeB
MKKSKIDLPVIDQAIPNKASSAFIRANKKALRLKGEVLVARNGNLGKLSTDGSFVVVKKLQAPVKVNAGVIIKRARIVKGE